MRCKRCNGNIKYKTWKKYNGYSQQCLKKLEEKTTNSKEYETDLIDEMESLLKIDEDSIN